MLFNDTFIRNKKVKNRIVFPPVVDFNWSDSSGLFTEKHLNHYTGIAKGGAGTIIIEATAVSKPNRIHVSQPGIWSDKHIPMLAAIAETCHNNGVVVILQIHHGGLSTPESVSMQVKGPSVNPSDSRSSAMTADEIITVRDAFIEAAVRAERAGIDGIELHGAHGYLLNQFASEAFNKRTDEYGGSPEKRMQLATEIIEGIRKQVNNEFLIGYRLGSNSPETSDGILIARHLDKLDIDYIHVSHGGASGIIPASPESFNYNWIVYNGTLIKKEVNKPVIVVNEIKTPERAAFLIENNLADFVAIGRDFLTDPEWVNKAISGDQIDYCIQCKPTCKRYDLPELCPVSIGKLLKSSKL